MVLSFVSWDGLLDAVSKPTPQQLKVAEFKWKDWVVTVQRKLLGKTAIAFP